MNPALPPILFRQTGLSLVELIFFIVIVAVLAAGLFGVFASSLRSAPQGGQTDSAAEIAQQRMELILAQRRAVGFAAFADPCVPGPGPAVCAPPAGYGVSSNIVTGWSGDPLNYKVITVTVTGPVTSDTTALAANY